MKGKFFSFEGTEGSGKTTQVQLLAEFIREKGLPIAVFRDPGGTPIGEEIRRIFKDPQCKGMVAETELFLLCASRAQLVREMIRPLLEGGTIVICDRYYDSTFAYQCYARGLDRAVVTELTKFVCGDIWPDITFFLDICQATSDLRRQEMDKDRMEEEGREFFSRVLLGYQALAMGDPGRIKRIDGEQTKGMVAAEIRSHLHFSL